MEGVAVTAVGDLSGVTEPAEGRLGPSRDATGNVSLYSYASTAVLEFPMPTVVPTSAADMASVG